MTSSSRPPYSSGMREPNRPNAFICSTIASGYVSVCSSADACGITSLRTHSRTVATSSSANSGSVTALSKLRQRVGHKGLDPVVGEGPGQTARPAVARVDDVPHRVDDDVGAPGVGPCGREAELSGEVDAHAGGVDRGRPHAGFDPVDDAAHAPVAPEHVAGVVVAVDERGLGG